MKIVLSGASGYLGRALVAHWTAEGHSVMSTGAWRLGQPIPEVLFEGAEFVLHAAHDFSRDAPNEAAAEAFFRASACARRCFLSSWSAHAEAGSHYGQTKWRIEKMCRAEGVTIVRPGLVAGTGGMFQRMAQSLLRWRVAPLVQPDDPSVSVVALEDFLSAMTKIIALKPSPEFSLFDPELLTGRAFAEAIWRGGATSGWVLPVPARLALRALGLAGAERMRDSLAGQLSNRQNPHRSGLPDLVPGFLPAREAVARAAKECLC